MRGLFTAWLWVLAVAGGTGCGGEQPAPAARAPGEARWATTRPGDAAAVGALIAWDSTTDAAILVDGDGQTQRVASIGANGRVTHEVSSPKNVDGLLPEDAVVDSEGRLHMLGALADWGDGGATPDVWLASGLAGHGHSSLAGALRAGARMRDGDVVVAGVGDDGRLLVARLARESGDPVWEVRFGNGHDEAVATGVGVDGIGRIFVTGYFGAALDLGDAGKFEALPSDVGSAQILVARLDAAGKVVWAKAFPRLALGPTPGAEQLQLRLAVAPDGQMTIVGPLTLATEGPVAVNFGLGPLAHAAVSDDAEVPDDVFVVALDPDGAPRWQQSIQDVFVGGIAADPSGNVMVAGLLAPTDAGFELGRMLDPCGHVLWTLAGDFSSGSSGAVPSDVAITTNGDLLVAGVFKGRPKLAGLALRAHGSEIQSFALRLAGATPAPPNLASPPPSCAVPSDVPPLLTVTIDGAGRVTSDPPGIDCPGACTAPFPSNTRVVLSARDDGRVGFVRWQGACAAAAAEGPPGFAQPARTCVASLSQARTVTARFEAPAWRWAQVIDGDPYETQTAVLAHADGTATVVSAVNFGGSVGVGAGTWTAPGIGLARFDRHGAVVWATSVATEATTLAAAAGAPDGRFALLGFEELSLYGSDGVRALAISTIGLNNVLAYPCIAFAPTGDTLTVIASPMGDGQLGTTALAAGSSLVSVTMDGETGPAHPLPTGFVGESLALRREGAFVAGHAPSGAIIAGTTLTSGGSETRALVAIDPAGAPTWALGLGTGISFQGVTVRSLADEGAIIVFAGSDDPRTLLGAANEIAGDPDGAVVARIAADGVVVWWRRVALELATWGARMAVDAHGAALVGGRIGSDDPTTRFVRLAPDGTTAWTWRAPVEPDFAFDLDSDGEALVALSLRGTNDLGFGPITARGTGGLAVWRWGP